MKALLLHFLKHKLGLLILAVVIGLGALSVRGITRWVLGVMGADEAKQRMVGDRVFDGFGMAAMWVVFAIGVVLVVRQMKQEIREKKPFWMQPPKLPEPPLLAGVPPPAVPPRDPFHHGHAEPPPPPRRSP